MPRGAATAVTALALERLDAFTEDQPPRSQHLIDRGKDVGPLRFVLREIFPDLNRHR